MVPTRIRAQRRRRRITLIGGILGLGIAGPAMAMTVFDPTNYAAAMEQLLRLTKQLATEENILGEAVKQVQELNRMNSAMGSSGIGGNNDLRAIMSIASDLLTSGNGPFGQSGRLKNMKVIIRLPEAEGIRAPDLSEAADSKGWADQALFGKEPPNASPNADDRPKVQRQYDIEAQRRDDLWQESMSKSLAISWQEQNAVADSQERMRRLSEFVEQAKDMRGDIAANSAVNLALLEAIERSNALAATQLELDAARDARSMNRDVFSVRRAPGAGSLEPTGPGTGEPSLDQVLQ